MEPISQTKNLELTYEEYLKNGKSIADTRLDKYIIYEKLDKGAFGTVYRGMNDITKKEVAVKLVDLAAIQRDQKSPKVRQIRKRLAKTESEMMKHLDSPHVMKLWDVYENQNLKIMVIEFCNKGTLSDIIYRRQRIPEKDAIQILKQIIFGVAEMHKHNIVHRDLKSENIMCHNGVYKIVDLGFAKMLPSNSEIYQGTVLGTIITMAPQVMKRKPYGVKADIWSLGVIFYEMIYGIIPFEPMKAIQMYEQIISKDIFPNGGRVNGYKPSNQVIGLMKQILVVDQDKRLTWEQLISHKVFKVNRNKLPEEYRITVNLENLQKQQNKTGLQKTEEQRLKQLPNQDMQWPQLEPIKISKLTRKQKQKKIEQIDKTQKKMLQHAKIYYLECLKTEYILKEIIIQIQEQNIFNLEERETVQLLNLLINRCYCNMSNVKFNLGNEKNEVIHNLMNTVKDLYNAVKQKFEEYGEKLRKIEDKVTSIISDRFSKIFSNNTFKKKDIFLGGVEVQRDESKIHLQENKLAGYTKDEQIQYTYEKYILPMIHDLKKQNLLVKKLAAYKKINEITHERLEKMKFHELVDQILRQ